LTNKSQEFISQTSTHEDYRFQTDVAWLWPETASHTAVSELDRNAIGKQEATLSQGEPHDYSRCRFWYV